MDGEYKQRDIKGACLSRPFPLFCDEYEYEYDG